MNPLIKELTAKLNINEKTVEIFRNGISIHIETVTEPADDWFGLDIDGNDFDFNIWDNDGVPTLTIYHVYKNEEGFYHTDTNVFERIPLESL